MRYGQKRFCVFDTKSMTVSQVGARTFAPVNQTLMMQFHSISFCLSKFNYIYSNVSQPSPNKLVVGLGSTCWGWGNYFSILLYWHYHHRYLWKVDFSRHINLQKIHFNNTRALVAGINKLMGWQGRQAGSTDVRTLAANIFAAATDRTNVHNKRGDWCN